LGVDMDESLPIVRCAPSPAGVAKPKRQTVQIPD
jgi:hypothetical protein